MRAIIEDYYDIQKLRIEVENQIRAIQQEKAKGNESFLREFVLPRLKEIEKETNKVVAKDIESEPMWNYWLKNIKGIGPIMAGGLLAWLGDLDRFGTISKLWAYCGLHVGEDGNAVKRAKGIKSNWNTRLKCHCWKIGEQFVKAKGGYRELYDQFRKEYDEKYSKKVYKLDKNGKKVKKRDGKGFVYNYTDGHRYAMAKRKTVKVFLAHLWMKYREMKELPMEHPFIIGRDGHQHLIEPLKE